MKQFLHLLLASIAVYVHFENTCLQVRKETKKKKTDKKERKLRTHTKHKNHETELQMKGKTKKHHYGKSNYMENKRV